MTNNASSMTPNQITTQERIAFAPEILGSSTVNETDTATIDLLIFLATASKNGECCTTEGDTPTGM